jgi:WD40 repeat protein
LWTSALREHNTTHPPEERIRLRMALHVGEVSYDPHGVTATSVNLTFRLVDAQPVKTALTQSPGTLAVITSAWFFDEVVRHSRITDPSTFRPVAVSEKETDTVGWISLPDHPYPPDPTRLVAGPPPETVPPPAFTVGGDLSMRHSAIAGGNIDQSRRTRIGIGGGVLAVVLLAGGGVVGYQINESHLVQGMPTTPALGQTATPAQRTSEPAGPLPRQTATLPDPENYPSAVAFSPDGKTIATMDGRKVVRLLDPATGETTVVFADKTSSYISDSMALSADGKLLAMTVADTIYLKDVASHATVTTLGGQPETLHGCVGLQSGRLGHHRLQRAEPAGATVEPGHSPSRLRTSPGCGASNEP